VKPLWHIPVVMLTSSAQDGDPHAGRHRTDPVDRIDPHS
jgi:hypothetical protein